MLNQRLRAAIAMASLLGSTGCPPNTTGISDSPAAASPAQLVAELEALASSVSLESAAWRDQVDKAVRDLRQAAHEAIANDLDAVVTGAIQAAGQEARCTADFFRDRVRDDIRGLIAWLQGDPPPTPRPHICTVDPATIDLNWSPDAMRPIAISGYDFRNRATQRAAVHLEAVRADGSRVDASRLLAVSSPYAAVITIAQADGCWLINQNILRVRILDGDRELSLIPVTMPAIMREVHTGNTGEYLEYFPKKEKGDKDFGTRAPDVGMSINLRTEARIRNNKIEVHVWMDAREINVDTGAAVGGNQHTVAGSEDWSGWKVIYSPPDGRRIARLITADVDNPTTFRCKWPDCSSGELQGLTDLVLKYYWQGDRLGDDVGAYTKVKVFFKPLKVELETVNQWCQ